MVLTAVGVFLGYLIAVTYDRRKTERIFKEGYTRAMNALVSSLKTNSDYINQMFTVEFPRNCYPTYPLDTVALSFINFDARPYLPTNTTWPERFNKLRFEMDHINRRLLMDYLGGKAVNTALIQKTYADYLVGNTIDQTYLATHAHSLSGVVGLLLGTKTALDGLIQELERFGYKGEVVKPY
ncbi:MAG TPA: hypothetical protein VIT23_12125 [Terrimicrobiaceae bacterium]